MSQVPSLGSPSLGTSTFVTSAREAGPRATAQPPGRQFRGALEDSARGVLAGVETLAGLAPGGTMASAALHGQGGAPALQAQAGATVLGASVGGDAGSSALAALTSGTDQTMQLLALQQAMSVEQRQYTAVSNTMKARHDTAKTVLGNVR